MPTMKSPAKRLTLATTFAALVLAASPALADSSDVPTRRMHAILEDIATRSFFFGIEALWPAFYDGGAAVLDTVVGDGVEVVLDDTHAIEETLYARQRRGEHEIDVDALIEADQSERDARHE